MADVFDFGQQLGSGSPANARNGLQQLALLLEVGMAFNLVVDLFLGALDLSVQVSHELTQ